MTDRQLYTVKEFCHRNSIGKTTFFELVKTGAVRTVKLGVKTLVPAESEREWHASLKSTPDPTHDQRSDCHVPGRTAANRALRNARRLKGKPARGELLRTA
jgi:4'-phosphopantetheinyl transferase EntD